jgi:hypothetical protein
MVGTRAMVSPALSRWFDQAVIAAAEWMISMSRNLD